jgi:predicted O-methyltransferase YrrM
MKVIFAIPTIDGNIRSECVLGLATAQSLLHRAGIEHDLFILSDCPVITTARNTLVAMFIATNATDLFFIDADVGFDAAGVMKILERPEKVVAGIYPLKREMAGFPVQIKTEDGIPIGRAGLIEANLLPAGFMRIKRIVFERMMEAYPELQYKDNVIDIAGSGVTQAYDFFGMGIDKDNQRWTTEDYSFCQRWRDIGGQLWVYPDIDFAHVGRKSYRGNYHRYLLRQPGGKDAPKSLDLGRAVRIPGWLSTKEAEWLAEQAARHHVIVEMGSAYGRSTRAIADNMPTGAVLYAVDNWKTGIPEMTDEDRNTFYEEFCHYLEDHITAGRVIPIRCDHGVFDPSTVPIADMVFIDGDHREAAVRRDIAMWMPRLTPGGLLCGHDLDWKWVETALNNVLANYRQVSDTAIWYWESQA